MMPLLATLKFITSHPLNRANKLESIIRFARWQIGSRLVTETSVWEWINGSRFFVRPGETGVTGNIYVGLHEFPDMAFVLHSTRSDDLFVDVGANVGSYTILACSAIGAHGYAFEPVQETYGRLVENVRLNNMEDRVTAMKIGLADEEGEASFTVGLDSTNHALAPGEDIPATSVPVSTLDAVLGDNTPSIIKIDVEGYETLVLRGATQTLKKPGLRSLIVELNGSGERYGFDESGIVETICEHGFRPYSYDPLTRSLVVLEGKNPSCDNTIFIRDIAFIQERIETAPTINVLGRQL